MASPTDARSTALDRSDLLQRYLAARRQTNRLCEPLSSEDMTVQVATEASPTKWHLAHTTWFFETFILERFEPGFRPYDEAFRVLYNSYYRSLGERHPRPRRGMLTRPGAGEIHAYRDTVDERIARTLDRADDDDIEPIAELLELGIQHEQQHQELILTDVKLLLHANPLQPSYHVAGADPRPARDPGPMRWIDHAEGVVEIGHDADEQAGVFAYDNEGPRHRRFVEPFALASRPVTNGEYAEFIGDGGYQQPLLWLDDGWTIVQRDGWSLPTYWRREGRDQFSEFTMNGRRAVDPFAPVTHLSFFEADAFARWTGARLPTEVEWEHAARSVWDDARRTGQFVESGALHPALDATAHGGLRGLAGGLWEWTRSAHEPYPGYRPPEGAVGEYNGKFMCGTFVLRGGSCATPRDHVRITYRNFFEPAARWQFSGIRPARS